MASYKSYSCLLLVFLAIIGLAVARNFDEKRLDSFCYEECTKTFFNNECLAFCIRRSYNDGSCKLDQQSGIFSCCCKT
ncbi:hypothetical protein RND71_030398 [Anisodus tanguticus]|uniref:Defensin-like domain-containing protein n=1 Tax=Anisodus tanguticus TaxID=243964 RepID=A0AAE1V861_9SOLA|nr:hypothetical protein RND71_030398 [Anisodus tanguticus]